MVLMRLRFSCLKGSGSWADGVQARHYHQCSSTDAAHSIMGSEMARPSEESGICYSHNRPKHLPSNMVSLHVTI